MFGLDMVHANNMMNQFYLQDKRIAEPSQLLKIKADLLDKVFDNCRVVYYPGDGKYPIEHSKECNKDQRKVIESLLRKK